MNKEMNSFLEVGVVAGSGGASGAMIAKSDGSSLLLGMIVGVAISMVFCGRRHFALGALRLYWKSVAKNWFWVQVVLKGFLLLAALSLVPILSFCVGRQLFPQHDLFRSLGDGFILFMSFVLVVLLPYTLTPHTRNVARENESHTPQDVVARWAMPVTTYLRISYRSNLLCEQLNPDSLPNLLVKSWGGFLWSMLKGSLVVTGFILFALPLWVLIILDFTLTFLLALACTNAIAATVGALAGTTGGYLTCRWHLFDYSPNVVAVVCGAGIGAAVGMGVRLARTWLSPSEVEVFFDSREVFVAKVSK